MDGARKGICSDHVRSQAALRVQRACLSVLVSLQSAGAQERWRWQQRGDNKDDDVDDGGGENDDDDDDDDNVPPAKVLAAVKLVDGVDAVAVGSGMALITDRVAPAGGDVPEPDGVVARHVVVVPVMGGQLCVVCGAAMAVAAVAVAVWLVVG